MLPTIPTIMHICFVVLAPKKLESWNEDDEHSAGFQYAPPFVQCLLFVLQVFEHIGSGNRIECRVWKVEPLSIHACRIQACFIAPPDCLRAYVNARYSCVPVIPQSSH